MTTHIVQSPEWGEFKTKQGTTAVRVAGVQYTKHAIPATSFFYAYAPKINPFLVDFEQLQVSLKEQNCIAINFDVPNVLKNTSEGEKAQKLLEEYCIRAPKDTFARHNIILNLESSTETLLERMHKKHRYNIKYAQKNDVKVKKGETLEDFEEFYALLKDTAQRQKYFIHPKGYYQSIWELFHPQGICHILTTTHENRALASWMLFTYDQVLYYPYGGSANEGQNLFPSNLLGWEAILFGKEKGCTVFDMWGACQNLEDATDPWWGFSNFKIKFGGQHVEYINSYDMILNSSVYHLFNTANKVRWKLLRLKAGLINNG